MKRVNKMHIQVKSLLFLIGIAYMITLQGSQAATTTTSTSTSVSASASTSSSSSTSASTSGMTTAAGAQTTTYGQNNGSKAVTPSVLATMASTALLLVVNQR